MKKDIIKINYNGDKFFINGLNELKNRFGFELDDCGLLVRAEKSDERLITVNATGNSVTFTYYDKASFFRAFTIALQKLASGGGNATVKPLMINLGTMQNCSARVMNLPAVKELILTHAVMGYNYLQLYTETTYEIPSEPYFGFKLGRYTQNELKELVEYSKIFGVELIPCIQTLGHLSKLFDWGAFGDIHDIRDTMLVNYPKTYELIDKMLASVAECFDTDKINLGMDEAYFLGFGRYNWFIDDTKPDRNELFINHVKKVIELAEKHGFTQPSIWYDNIFEMNFKGYIIPPPEIWKGGFEQKVKDSFPNVKMIFWNYVIRDEKEFDRTVQNIHQLSNNVAFASMAHGYTSLAPENNVSARLVETAKNGCVKNGITDFMVTWWGSSISPFALLPAYYDFAERLSESSGVNFEERSRFLFGYTYSEFTLLDSPNSIGESQSELSVAEGNNLPFYAIANDPLLGKLDLHVPEGCERIYAEKAAMLDEYCGYNSPYAYIFKFEKALCEYLSVRAELGLKIKRAYDSRDMAALKKIIGDMPEIISATEKFGEIYGEYYLTFAKSFGKETWDIRFGGLCARLKYVAKTLQSFIDGKINSIAELDEERLPINASKIGQIIAFTDWNLASCI